MTTPNEPNGEPRCRNCGGDKDRDHGLEPRVGREPLRMCFNPKSHCESCMCATTYAPQEPTPSAPQEEQQASLPPSPPPADPAFSAAKRINPGGVCDDEATCGCHRNVATKAAIIREEYAPLMAELERLRARLTDQCQSRFRQVGAYNSDLCCRFNAGHDGPHEQLGAQWPNWSLDFDNPRRHEAVLCVSLAHADMEQTIADLQRTNEQLRRDAKAITDSFPIIRVAREAIASLSARVKELEEENRPALFTDGSGSEDWAEWQCANRPTCSQQHCARCGCHTGGQGDTAGGFLYRGRWYQFGGKNFEIGFWCQPEFAALMRKYYGHEPWIEDAVTEAAKKFRPDRRKPARTPLAINTDDLARILKEEFEPHLQDKDRLFFFWNEHARSVLEKLTAAQEVV